jgi:alanyl-tRNA synthetase
VATVKTDEIRSRYLDFFAQRDHRLVASDSLVPTNDPTLLFTGAGMNQFKEEFLGHVTDFRRATSCQKCIRTGDIENVGRTPFHFTFFEMLGNFSFGDYFKREAIHWAWEFLLQEMKLDPAKLHISVYEKDDEAHGIWRDEIGLPEGRIYRFGEHDNFWPADAPSLGPNGVCGPCSEIYVDRGGGCGQPTCGPACGCRRYLEIWNLVFTQFDRRDGGVLAPLPNKNIDTGMGLERMAAVMQDVPAGQDIDLMAPIVQAAAELTKKKYVVGEKTETAQRLKRIADHVRCVAMAMADGALPDRYGRGYVIRRLIRRAALDGRRLSREEPFLFQMLAPVVEGMGRVYPEVKERLSTIENILKGEEERFAEALGNSKGIREFEETLDRTARQRDKVIDGERIFYFFDTHGLPLEFIEEQLAQAGVSFDRGTFEAAMEARREESRIGSKMSDATMIFKGVAMSPEVLAACRKQSLSTDFVGYEEMATKARVLAIFGGDGLRQEARAGERVAVVLDRTAFYATGGGQIGDTGTITGEGGLEAAVSDTFMDHEFRLHAVEVRSGLLKLGAEITVAVDRARRIDIGRNHTATHILQWALREVLGDHVHQAGSEVTADRFRFDFTHPKALSHEELLCVEAIVNGRIFEDAPVGAVETTLDAARKAGAMALFGEKYGEIVRLVSMGDFSRELCGGTHLSSTAQVCQFKIVSEESVAAGVRRITALTGRGAAAHVVEMEELLDEAMDRLKANPASLLQRIDVLQKELKSQKQDLQKARSMASRSSAADIFANVQDAGGVSLVAAEIEGADPAALREAADLGRKKIGSGVVVLGCRQDDKVSLVVGVTADLVSKGLHAGKIIKEVAAIVGGSGGGRPDLAQAGGKDPAKLPEAIAQARDIVAAQVKK